MLKCLIVDDEIISREGVYEAINWQKLEIEIIGLAKNGKEGFDIFQEYLPDLIISDVKMPIMDGLQMSEKILQIQPTTKIILISAYSEFSYAQQAIRFGVEDYLLKPVDEAELWAAVSNLSKKHRQEQIHQKDSQLKSLMEQGNLKTGSDDGIVMIFDGEKRQHKDSLVTEGIYRGWFIQLFQIDKKKWSSFLLQQKKGYISDLSLSGDLRLAFEQASEAETNGSYWDISILSWSSILQQRRKWISSAPMRQETLKICVDKYPTGSIKDVRKYLTQIQNLLRMLNQFQGIEADEIWRYCYEVLLGLEHRYFILGDDSNKLRIKDKLAQAETFAKLSQCFLQIIEDTIINAEINTNHDLIRQIKHIVNKRYAEDISSKTIADEVFLTPNYMGKMFRENTGFYLNDYILEVRMKMARQLLDETNQSISEIANAVGFSSASYFTSLFKKKYGQTPKEFRRKNLIKKDVDGQNESKRKYFGVGKRFT